MAVAGGDAWGELTSIRLRNPRLPSAESDAYCPAPLESTARHGGGLAERQTNSIAATMAVKIRLKRIGAKNTPAYRIVVADQRSPRDGRCIEEIGSYTPLQSGTNYVLNLDRAKYWLSVGAQPSETVASFIRRASRQVPA